MAARAQRAVRVSTWASGAILIAGLALATAAPGAVAATTRPAVAATARQAVASGPKDVLAKAAAIAVASTGRVLWSRDLNTELPMASITKVMTALVVIRAGDLGRKITGCRRPWSATWPSTTPATGGLRPGDTLTARPAAGGPAAALRGRRRLHPGRGVRPGPARLHRQDERHRQAARHDPGRTSPTSTGCPGRPDIRPIDPRPTHHPRPGGHDLGRLPLPVASRRSYQDRGGPRASRVLLAEPQPAPRLVPRRDRDQDRVHHPDAGHCLLFEATRDGSGRSSG